MFRWGVFRCEAPSLAATLSDLLGVLSSHSATHSQVVPTPGVAGGEDWASEDWVNWSRRTRQGRDGVDSAAWSRHAFQDMPDVQNAARKGGLAATAAP